jgi:hypothetical protein
MQTITESPSLPQVSARSVSEILRGLAHPLALAAARLDWLAHDDERAADENAAFGNPSHEPFQRLRIAALRLAAEQCRDALRWGCTHEGTGYAPAIALLRELAASIEARAEDEAQPCELAHFTPAALAQLQPHLDGHALVVASYRADAALLRFAVSILERETPPTVRDLVS